MNALPELIDVNCAVGEWPFRRVPCNTVERLLERMDRLRIARAAVSRLEAVFYKDCLVANRELAALVAPHAGRFFPLYTANPGFPGWEDDLEIVVAELGLTSGRGGLRLYPSYHAYALDGPEAAPLLARAQEMGVPVAVTARLEDERTHHWLCKVRPVPPAAIAAAIAAFPGVRWIVGGLRAREIAAVGHELAAGAAAPAVGEGGGTVLFDLSLVQGPLDECALLARAVGVQRLAFGTNLPLTVAESPLLALQHADLPPDELALIAAGNAQRTLA